MPLFTLPADSDLSAVAIFNVLDSSYAGGMSPLKVGSANQAALQAAVNAAQTAGGGVILIPSIKNAAYPINGQITLGTNLSPPSAVSVIFAGTGQGEGGQATLLKVADDGMTPDDSDLFVIDTGGVEGDADVGGITFQDLQIEYVTGTYTKAPAAIHIAGGQNVRILRCLFTDCPRGVWFEHSLQCSMLECTATNDNNAGTVVTHGGNTDEKLDSIETHINNCLFRTKSDSGIAMKFISCEHVRVINTRLEGYQQGIVVTPGPNHGNIQKVYLDNISCFPSSDVSTVGAAVIIQPTGGKYVKRMWFGKCEFTAPDLGTMYDGAGIVIDPVNGSGGGGHIDQIRFVDCYSCLWNGPGMDIIGGTNIEILGGYYSCNGVSLSPPNSLPSAGIALTGTTSGSAAPVGVRITGAACNNSILSEANFEPATQEIGIYVSGSSSSVRIQGCDLTGNLQYGAQVLGPSSGTSLPTNIFIRHCDFTGLASPLHVSGLVSNVQVTDCPGYNDQATALTTSSPAAATVFNGVTYGYYGPVAFYASGGSGVLLSVDGHSTGLGSGGFVLGPGENSEITLATGGHLPTTFVMVGK
jgi:hypothetical protein